MGSGAVSSTAKTFGPPCDQVKRGWTPITRKSTRSARSREASPRTYYIATTLAWPARPLQPLHTAKEGVTWSFLASTPPAQDHVQIEGSLVIITKQERAQRQDPTLPRLIAPKATMHRRSAPDSRPVGQSQGRDPGTGGHGPHPAAQCPATDARQHPSHQP